MMTRSCRAKGLAVLQLADLVAATFLSQFGDAHLDHLGVPRWLRPLLPVTKTAAAVVLITTAERHVLRSIVGGALVAYYSSAVTFTY